MTSARPGAGEPLVLAGVTLAVLAWSGIDPYDRLTWWLEVAPVLVGLVACFATWSRYRLSSVLYRLLTIHAVILMVGGHYTYAQVPAGFWIRDALDLSRNHYDRLGHFAQGFVPAILAREILIRSSPLASSRWLPFLVVCVCLAFSAFYELIEWWAALLGGESAEAFLGTQGDVWDTQWDMFLALVGAIASQLLLSRAHDRSLSAEGIPARSHTGRRGVAALFVSLLLVPGCIATKYSPRLDRELTEEGNRFLESMSVRVAHDSEPGNFVDESIARTADAPRATITVRRNQADAWPERGFQCFEPYLYVFTAGIVPADCTNDYAFEAILESADSTLSLRREYSVEQVQGWVSGLLVLLPGWELGSGPDPSVRAFDTAVNELASSAEAP